jgi:hypothetical protein
MAYLAAVDVTVTLAPQDIDFLGVGKRVSFPSVAFGNGALQYTALGIPMPAIGYFGMKKVIDRVFIEQPANGFIYSFDRTNLKLRIFLGAAVGAITCNAVTAGTPAGNLANLVAANHVHALANLVQPVHSHDLTILANGAGAGVGVIVAMANTANHALVSDTAAGDVIPGGNVANKGGVGNTTPANGVSGDAVGTIPANSTGNFVGDAMATHVHGLTGAGGAAEAALAEMDDGVAPAATTLYMQVIGQ